MRESVINVLSDGSFTEPIVRNAKEFINEELFNRVDGTGTIRKFYDKHNYAILYDTNISRRRSDDEYMIFKEAHPLFNLLVIRSGIRGSRYTDRYSKIYTADISSTTLNSIRKFNDEMRVVVKNSSDYFYKNI
jgi:hypothetical protein